jgi:hypothetical protein
VSYKPRTLFRLIEDINVSLFLPHIHRPFVWDEDQIRRLFDSLMRDYAKAIDEYRRDAVRKLEEMRAAHAPWRQANGITKAMRF